MSSHFRTLLVTALVCLLAVAAFPQASTVGQWSGVMTWPSTNSGWVPTHAVLGTDGKVYYWGSYGDGLVTHVWDPASNTVSVKAAPAYNVFCMGHTHLADGRIFTAGGHIDDYTGYAHASIYNSNSNSWTSVPDMNAGRWYPTNTTLANGDVLVVSGTIHGPASSQVYNEVPQVYQVATNSWRTLSSATLHLQLYPFMFLAPNGKVFLAGWNPDTKYLDTSGSGAWTAVASSIHGWRNYGNAVMYDAGKIMLIGGDGDSSTRTPTASAEKIDLNAATPAWQSVASMHFARRQQNATLLPDGTILVTGGSSASGFDVASGAVYAAEIYNPANNTWSVMASMAKYRGYHSFAILLPDGRVLSAGGQINSSGSANGSNAEIYSPAYLFKGARPSITSAPTSVAYGQTALIGTSDSIARVTWIRLSAVTHSFNQEQRFLNLNFSATSGGVNVTFPSSANLSPPGAYMLFLLNSTGVPSVAKIIQIGGSAPTTTGSVSGTVTDSATNAAISGATVSYNGGSATTDASGNYSLSNVPTGSVSVTAAASGYNSSSATVNVTANTTTTQNFQLAPPTGGSCPAPATARTINICSPQNASTAASPVHISAAAKAGTSAVQVMQIYVDGSKKYELANVTHIETDLAMSDGTHRVTVQAVDASGAFKSTVNITVGGGGSSCATAGTARTVVLCQPVANATVSSPVHISAAAHPGSTTTQVLQLYVDGSKKTEAPAAGLPRNASGDIVWEIDQAMAAGGHRVTVQAMDGTGAYKATVNITVQ